MISFKFY